MFVSFVLSFCCYSTSTFRSNHLYFPSLHVCVYELASFLYCSFFHYPCCKLKKKFICQLRTFDLPSSLKKWSSEQKKIKQCSNEYSSSWNEKWRQNLSPMTMMLMVVLLALCIKITESSILAYASNRREWEGLRVCRVEKERRTRNRTRVETINIQTIHYAYCVY